MVTASSFEPIELDYGVELVGKGENTVYQYTALNSTVDIKLVNSEMAVSNSPEFEE